MSETRSISRPLVVGEVLFDCFPDGSTQLGGAPFNVAWHLRAFGLDPLLLTAVGEDEAGEMVLRAFGEWDLDASGVKRDPTLPTGRVRVSLDEGSPAFEIESPSAWDEISSPGVFEDACLGRFSLLYHGSLALRSARSASTIIALRRALSGRVMVDLNLREGWWTPEGVETALRGTSFLKINGEELDALDVQDGVTLRAAVHARAARLGERNAIPEIVVTLGEAGAVALLENETITLPAAPLPGEQQDTVGAGDAFSAVTILGRLRAWNATLTIRRATEFAARVCTIQGAVSRERAFYEEVLAAWGIEDEQS